MYYLPINRISCQQTTGEECLLFHTKVGVFIHNLGRDGATIQSCKRVKLVEEAPKGGRGAEVINIHCVPAGGKPAMIEPN